jgi:hypothetical protein
MFIFIFTLVAFIIIFPILYFVPLGMNMKAKLFLAGLSFLLTIFALLASYLYPFWLVALMTFVILGITAYFFENRFGQLFFVKDEGDLGIVENEYSFSLDKDHGNIHKEMEGFSNKEDADIIVDLEKTDTHEMKIAILNEETDLTVNNSIEPSDEEEKIAEFADLEKEKLDLNELEEVYLDELKDFENEDSSIQEESEESTESLEEEEIILNNQSNDSLNDLEKLLSDFEEESMEKNEDVLLTNELFTDDITDVEQEDNYLEKIYESLMHEDIVEDELKESLKEVSSTIEEAETAKIELYDKIDNSEEQDELKEQVHTMSHSNLESLNALEDEITKQTKKALLETVFAEITLYQSELNTEEFEGYLEHYLQISLSDKDYYSFAKVLMEHYISTRQSLKLNQFINQIEPRFKKYPYLSSEMEYLKELSLG